MNKQPRTRTRTRLAPGIRRASILDAATRLILRDGTTGLTMEDIAAEASVARGTLYLYAVLVEGLHKTSTATTVAAAQKLARRTLTP